MTALTKAVVTGIAERVEPYGLTPMEFNLLRVFLDKRNCTVTQLAAILPVDAPRVSRVVNKMVDMGLLRRRRLRNDRRVVKLALTEEGRTLTRKLHDRVQTYDARLMEGVSEEEARAFVATTLKIAANSTALERPG